MKTYCLGQELIHKLLRNVNKALHVSANYVYVTDYTLNILLHVLHPPLSYLTKE